LGSGTDIWPGRRTRRRTSPAACSLGLAVAALICSSNASCTSSEASLADAGADMDGQHTNPSLDATARMDAAAEMDATAAEADANLPDASEPIDASDAAPVDLDAVSSDLPPACEPAGANGGSRWQDLYACYFGPSGIANCALNSGCHVENGGGSAYWVCGTTSESCWDGMSTAIVAGVTDPADTALYSALRKPDGTGDMPVTPGTLVFTYGDLARIAAWIEAGAPNN